jgi:hypothetical protein
MVTREQLLDDYMDYINNYLTIEKYAEHRGLTVLESKALILLAESCLRHNHPEA